MSGVGIRGARSVKSGVAVVIVVAAILLCGCSKGPVGPQGPQGPSGIAGAVQDGALGVYGDGSAGSVEVASDMDWRNAPPANLQFVDLTIDAGVTLTIPSGMKIRCLGQFTNYGTLRVFYGAGGALADATSGNPVYTPANAGIAITAAGNGGYGDNAHPESGAPEAIGLVSEGDARVILEPGPHAGGGAGVAAIAGGFRQGAWGGGSVVILAGIGVVNSSTGIISADGEPAPFAGGGGGGGGVILLASLSGIIQDGVISAQGGLGGAANSQVGAGGGGGGGIVHLLSPIINATPGGILVNGGDGGAYLGVNVFSSLRAAGGSGGGSGGSGAAGGGIASDGTAISPGAGGSGWSLQSLLDPTEIYL